MCVCVCVCVISHTDPSLLLRLLNHLGNAYISRCSLSQNCICSTAEMQVACIKQGTFVLTEKEMNDVEPVCPGSVHPTYEAVGAADLDIKANQFLF